MVKEKNTKQRKVKSLNNLGDYIRSTPELSKVVERIDKYNFNKQKKRRSTKDHLMRNRDGKADR